MMKNLVIKNSVPYIVAVIAFLLISIFYFTPDIFQNKTLYQHDVVTGSGIGEEAKEFYNKTGEKSLWTNSLFGGMPTYQISPSYPSTKILNQMQKCSWLYLPAPASYLFILLFGAFLLFVALRVNPWLAILGAIAYAFSSYFLIIIQAGHIWKLWVLAYIPPTFAGIIWMFRGKYLLGCFVAKLYMALQLLSNHPQMTYYFGLVVLIFLIANFINSYKTKQLPVFFKATGFLVASVLIAFSLNITNLYHTADYTKYSIRGGSELSHNQLIQTKGGLDRSYATAWSYGIGETFSLLIPDVKGGSSSNFIGYKIVETPSGNSLVKDPTKNRSKLNKISDPQIREYISQQAYYWGNQPGTSGPVYVGAFIVFLFVLGIFIVQGWFKWVLVLSTILSIMLSWGSNFMWFTNLFLDYFPYYNKLRAVSSILVIAELCIPILAILTLKEIISNPDVLKLKKKQFYISIASTVGLIILFIALPKLFFSFISNQEEYGFKEMLNDPKVSVIYRQLISDLESVRVSIFREDAFRSLLIICFGLLATLLFVMKKINVKLFVVLVTALVLFDMWQVDKRYLSSKDFKTKTQISNIFPKTPVDEEILKDKSLDYRVFNLSTSTFNDGYTSFYHKSIGGYHGAKLRRYQDIIEIYLSIFSAQNVKEALNTKYFDVLNMLNTKYIILPKQDGSQELLENPNALGNAWFVGDIKWVNNADEEIEALADINPAETAVINKKFKKSLEGFVPSNKEIIINLMDGDANLSGNDAHFSDNSYINLIEYNPNKLVYETSAINQKLAVFSEIYYPKGWYAYIDGKETEILRADYILRALIIPEGKHTVEFHFAPKSYPITETIAYIGYVLLFGLFIVFFVIQLLNKKKKLTNV